MASGMFSLPGSRKVYLLRDGVEIGDQLVSVAKKGCSSSSFVATAPPVTRNTGSIFAGWTSNLSSTSAGVVYLPTSVNLSNYKKLFIKGIFNFNASGSFNAINLVLCAWTSIGTYADDNRIFRVSPLGGSDSNFTGNSSINASLGYDITNLSNQAIIGFYMARSGSGYTNITVTDIWLEP